MNKDSLSQCLRLAAFTYALGGMTCGASWVDPDTDQQYHTTEAYTRGDDREYGLVFSDEFEVAGRSLADGDDPRWTALNKNDCKCLAFLLFRQLHAFFLANLNVLLTFLFLLHLICRHQRGAALLQPRECQDGEWGAEHYDHPQDQQIQSL